MSKKSTRKTHIARDSNFDLDQLKGTGADHAMHLQIRPNYEPEKILSEGWRAILEALPYMTEAELKAAIDKESTSDERRIDVIVRLHRRYSRVRQEREIQELLS